MQAKGFLLWAGAALTSCTVLRQAVYFYTVQTKTFLWKEMTWHGPVYASRSHPCRELSKESRKWSKEDWWGGGCWEKPSLSWRKSGRAFLSVNPCGGTMTSCWRQSGQYSVTGLQNVNLMTVGKTLFVPAPWKPLQVRQRQRWAFVSIRWTFESIIPKKLPTLPKIDTFLHIKMQISALGSFTSWAKFPVFPCAPSVSLLDCELWFQRFYNLATCPSSSEEPQVSLGTLLTGVTDVMSVWHGQRALRFMGDLSFHWQFTPRKNKEGELWTPAVSLMAAFSLWLLSG